MLSKRIIQKIVVGTLSFGFVLSSPNIVYPVNAQDVRGGGMTIETDELKNVSEMESEETSTEEDTEDASTEAASDDSEETSTEAEKQDASDEETEAESTDSEETIGTENTEEAIRDDELTPDCGVADARRIYVNQRVSDSDDQYFIFTTDADGYFTINFQHEMTDNNYRYYAVSLYDENMNKLSGYDVKGYDKNVTTYRYGLPEGTYYIRVYLYYTDAPSYSLCVNYTQSSTYETEKNNTFTTADTIRVGTTYSGNSFDSLDDDYYKFTLSKQGYISINLQHVLMDDNDKKYRVYIYNDDQRTVHSFYSKGYDDNYTSAKIGLLPGVYYLLIDPLDSCSSFNGPEAKPYSFKVNYTASGVWETELNDSKSTADSLKWGTQYYGTLMDPYDKDYYTFSLTSNKKTELVFTHKEHSYEKELWKVQIIDAKGNTIWSKVSTGYDTTICSGSLSLSAGKYYVYIYDSSSSAYSVDTYGLRIQTPTIKVSSVMLNKTWVGLDVGKSATLYASVAPTNAANKAVSWSSSDTSVATVTSGGKITAKGSGEAIVTCRATDGSGCSMSCTVLVYDNVESFVARIYTKALGRDAEEGGMYYWSSQIRYGARTPVNVAESFFFSPEFTKKNLSNTEYVKVLYRTFMGREYDQAGLNYWVGRLNRGESRKTILKSFAGCPEFQKIVKSFGL